MEDPSKILINEISSVKLNLIKELFEVLGEDLGGGQAYVEYHNYMDQGGSNVLIAADADMDLMSYNDWLEFNKQFENYKGTGKLDVDKIYEIYKKYGAIKSYIAATVQALDQYGAKVGLTDKGKILILGQMAHESAYFTAIKEIGGEYKKYGQPSGPYKKRYYGRGPIQVTGILNYKMITDTIFPKMGIHHDIYKNPELCEENMGIGAQASLAWLLLPGNGVFAVKAANAGDIKMCTKMVNGGYNGLDSRIKNTKLLLSI